MKLNGTVVRYSGEISHFYNLAERQFVISSEWVVFQLILIE